uniref:mRNA cap guanine-N(7) methyltransferase n=1 Tax=Globodera pallida TaxID=36090 RepID=A0A183BND1_GLOPA
MSAAATTSASTSAASANDDGQPPTNIAAPPPSAPFAFSSSSVVASHYNALPETGIRLRNDSRILHLRNFNNWLKSMLIAEFLERLSAEGCDGGATVLDLCCGKGGDLRKWRIGGIREIVMTDIAEVSLNDARERFHRMRDRRTGRPPFRAHFVPADLCEISLNDCLPADAPVAVDLCSCQFSVHYAFRSERCARQMLKNATDRLKPGGYFIGTVPDSSVIMEYLRRNNGHFANEVCAVSIDGDARGLPPLFGAQIQFRLEGVVDCPEYLCYFPLLTKLLNELGLELVYSRSFPDAITYFMKTRGREARDLMMSMNALETVGNARRLEADKGGAEAAQREYGPALAHMASWDANNNNNNNNNEGGEQQSWGKRPWHQQQQQQRRETVGTMSMSEWQVLTMYRVFAFQRRPVDDDDDSAGGGSERNANETQVAAVAATTTEDEEPKSINQNSESSGPVEQI